jgi:hypothetical protein
LAHIPLGPCPSLHQLRCGSLRFVHRLPSYYDRVRLLGSVHHRLRSGRTMARCGLRMMPPFPSSPLSAVRRVFPSTAGRLACQAGPSQHVDQLKPAPGMHCSTSGLSSPFVHLVANIGYPVLSRAAGSIVHHHEAEYSATPEVLAPVRVMLSRSIITYSTSSAPLTGTSQLHRTAAYMRCLRCAGAPRRPASGSGLLLAILS